MGTTDPAGHELELATLTDEATRLAVDELAAWDAYRGRKDDTAARAAWHTAFAALEVNAAALERWRDAVHMLRVHPTARRRR